MKKQFFSLLVFSALLGLFFTSSCKKETSKTLIDDIIGTYVVYDTLSDVAGGCSQPIVTKTYSSVISKTSETTIKFTYFFNESADIEASISGNNITVTSGFIPYGTYNPVITRSGTTLYGSYTFSPTSCNKNGAVKAVKQ